MACVERPRMEGAQSNLDVENYKTMAGMVGIAQSRLKPASQRPERPSDCRKSTPKSMAHPSLQRNPSSP